MRAHGQSKGDVLQTGAGNGSWLCEETYIWVAGQWTYLYRVVDSTGATIEFLLRTRRDAAVAKRFFQKALRSPGHPRPRVINWTRTLMPEGDRTTETERRTRSALSLPTSAAPEQYRGAGPLSDQAGGSGRVMAFREFHSAWRTLQGIETVHMIRKGQVRWLPKQDIAGHAALAA
jgi:transposase-like protein